MTPFSREHFYIAINRAQLEGFHHFAAELLRVYALHFPTPPRHETDR